MEQPQSQKHNKTGNQGVAHLICRLCGDKFRTEARLRGHFVICHPGVECGVLKKNLDAIRSLPR